MLMGCEEEADLPQDNLTLNEEILSLVNEHRRSNGLNDLLPNDICDLEALTHSRNMADGSVEFGHNGSDLRFNRIEAETGAIAFGENVAWGQTDAASVMESWLESEGHRKNIEGQFTHMGIGVASSNNGPLFFTQIFIEIN